MKSRLRLALIRHFDSFIYVGFCFNLLDSPFDLIYGQFNKFITRRLLPPALFLSPSDSRVEIKLIEAAHFDLALQL